ncbi:hypothetical protein F442_00402 [Phytophthora nicotianae P10297]|uniref:Uncharacterized protein n=1 Tax=Phytophthora nicotianae P10297 TaxID=1317064 RepID=W3A707_PHYNI|nr:hypothetical protein F442_00402 [Phytophthora nicotianae P10297]
MSSITQSDALELVVLLAIYGEEDTWVVMASVGAFDTPDRPLTPLIRFNI